MSTHAHEAFLVGPAAVPLRTLLPEVLPGSEARRFDDVYEAIAAAAGHPPDSLWLDVGDLGRDDLGALRVVRHAFPRCTVVLLTAGWQQPSEFLAGGVALGCRTLRRPISVRDLKLVLDSWPARPAAGPRPDLIAGLADQLNNPLAALVARLQLSALAQRQGDARDAADNLDLALRSAERMRAALRKLELLGGRLQIITSRLRALDVVAAAVHGLAADRLVMPPESDATLTADGESAPLALGRLVAVCLDLAGADGKVAIEVLPSATSCTVAVRLAEPLPLPAPPAELLEPFRLSRILGDPDLGLDLAVAQALATAQDGHLQPVVASGLLTGFELVFPA